MWLDDARPADPTFHSFQLPGLEGGALKSGPLGCQIGPPATRQVPASPAIDERRYDGRTLNGGVVVRHQEENVGLRITSGRGRLYAPEDFGNGLSGLMMTEQCAEDIGRQNEHECCDHDPCRVDLGVGGQIDDPAPCGGAEHQADHGENGGYHARARLLQIACPIGGLLDELGRTLKAGTASAGEIVFLPHEGASADRKREAVENAKSLRRRYRLPEPAGQQHCAARLIARRPVPPTSPADFEPGERKGEADEGEGQQGRAVVEEDGTCGCEGDEELDSDRSDLKLLGAIQLDSLMGEKAGVAEGVVDLDQGTFDEGPLTCRIASQIFGILLGQSGFQGSILLN